MRIDFQGFPWRFAVYFIVGGYLFLDLYAFQGPLHERLMQGRGASPEGAGGGHVAQVYGRPITRLELEEAMRDYLWKHHEKWDALGEEARRQTRWLVLETLVNDRILRSFRIMNGIDHLPPAAMANHEADMMKRQFADASEFPARLAAQQQTQASLDAAIRDAQLDEQWIAEKIAKRLAEITEADARAWYDDYQETLRIPKAWHAAHIFLTRHDAAKPDREAEIRDIHRRLTAGESSFAALAAAHSDDDRTKLVGGDLGWVTAARLPEDFIAALDKLTVGKVSEPVLTKLGWHLILVMDVHASRLPTFEDVRDEILAMLTSKRREEAVKSLVAELRERSLRPTQFVFYHPQIIDQAVPAS